MAGMFGYSEPFGGIEGLVGQPACGLGGGIGLGEALRDGTLTGQLSARSTASLSTKQGRLEAIQEAYSLATGVEDRLECVRMARTECS
jgi:hypothetical protein